MLPDESRIKNDRSYHKASLQIDNPKLDYQLEKVDGEMMSQWPMRENFWFG
jgi:hypothetical protein